jgi:hypothetical protein
MWIEARSWTYLSRKRSGYRMSNFLRAAIFPTSHPCEHVGRDDMPSVAA